MNTTKRIHALPIGDFEVHAAQSTCWCHPTETSPQVWVHNAKDCREVHERFTVEGKPGDNWVCVAEEVQLSPDASMDELKDLLISARSIAERKGEGTAWKRFSDRLSKAGIGCVTPRTFRICEGDVEPEMVPLAEAEALAVAIGRLVTFTNQLCEDVLVSQHYASIEGAKQELTAYRTRHPPADTGGKEAT